MVILCHSALRCKEIEDFLKELFTFCHDVVDVLGLFSGDKAENTIVLKQAIAKPQIDDIKANVKARCKVIISTPTQFLAVLPKVEMACSSLIVDKIDMHIALELSKELIDISKELPARRFKTILTT